MKRAINPAYTFNVSAKTLDLSAISGFNIRNLYAVLNQTTGVAVYLTVSPGQGYSSIAAGVLTLQASLAGMSNSDDLLILYEDGTAQPIIDAAAISSLGTDGSAPPTLPGGATGVRGWLRYLASLFPALVSGRWPVDGSAVTQPVSGALSVSNFPTTQAVSAASLPLPAGAATSTNQPSLITTTTGTAIRAVLVDPATGNGSLVQAFHNADNQAIGGTAYGLMTGGVDQLLNAAGNLDRKRGVAGDAMPVTGLAAEVPMLFNGATYDRWYGTTTLGARVNITASVLPTGAASSALQASINADGGSLSHVQNFPASQAVTGAFFQTTQPISAASLPLPAGAALDASVTGLSAKFGNLGQAAMAASAPVVIASNQSALPVAGPGAVGSAILGNPVVNAGADGSGLVRTIKTDAGGRQLVAAATTTIVASQASFTTVDNIKAQYVIPTGKTYRIKSIIGTMTTDATAGGRRIAVTVWDLSNNIISSGGPAQNQVASSVYGYCGLASVYASNYSSPFNLACPDLALTAGYKIGFSNTASGTIGAADAYTAITIIFEDETP